MPTLTTMFLSTGSSSSSSSAAYQSMLVSVLGEDSGTEDEGSDSFVLIADVTSPPSSTQLNWDTGTMMHIVNDISMIDDPTE